MIKTLKLTCLSFVMGCSLAHAIDGQQQKSSLGDKLAKPSDQPSDALRVSTIPATQASYSINFVFFDAGRVASYQNNQPNDTDFHIINLVQRLSGSAINFKVWPTKRIWSALQSDEPTCTPAKIKTPDRLERFIFSHPTGITASARVYSRIKLSDLNANLLNVNGEIISMKALSEGTTSFYLFHTLNRSYGSYMDSQIAVLDNRYKEQLISSTGFDSEVRLFLAERSSVLVATPILLHRSYPQLLNDFYQYRLANSPAYSLGHMMCNDNPTTRAFLASFNTSLETLHQEGIYTQTQLSSYPDALSSEMNALLDESGLRQSLEVKPNTELGAN